MTFKFCSLSSGSAGNCQYIESDDARIIVDAGFSGKRVEELLSTIDVCPSILDGIFVTHEHIDHVRGVGVLSRRYDLPIYANANTWIGMEKIIGRIKEKNIKVFTTEDYLSLKDIEIYPVGVFHDALEPVGYIINKGSRKISLITDTGWMNDHIIDKIQGSSLYYIESNHDIQMLKEGDYPWHLKQRILSARGHMSNEDTGRILGRILKGNREVVLLAHLSEDNNIPQLALDTVSESLINKGIDVINDISLGLSHRDRASLLYNL